MVHQISTQEYWINAFDLISQHSSPTSNDQTIAWSIGKAEQNAPKSPTATNNNIKQTSITLTDVDAGQGTTTYAYNTTNAAPASGWQESTQFTGLTAGTTYYFFAKYAGNDNYKEAVSTTGTEIKTTPAIVYSPIQKSVGDTAVTFLPAYDGNNCPYKFYSKSGEVYTEIQGITDMSSLATAISNAGSANVYTDATNATFYGITTRTWDDTFIAPSSDGPAIGLKSEFATALSNAEVKTVYGDYVNGEWVSDSSYNWDAHLFSGDKEPKLGAVSVVAFLNAYSSLLEDDAKCPWSSRFYGGDHAYMWYSPWSSWAGDPCTKQHGVVLTKQF